MTTLSGRKKRVAYFYDGEQIASSPAALRAGSLWARFCAADLLFAAS